MSNKLDELAELNAMRDVQRMNHAAERAHAMEPVREALDIVDALWAPRLADTQDRITALEVEIRADVLTGKATLKGDTSKWKAIYMQGRTSWNTKALEGYSAAHPEIERFRKVGEPSVSIRSA